MPAAHNIPALPARQTGVFLFYHISQSVEISNFPVLFPTIMGNCWIGDFITGGLTAKVDILGLTEDALYELIYGKWQPIVNRVLTGRCSYQIWKCAPAARYLIYGVGQQGKGLLSAGHGDLQIINQGSFQKPGIVYLLFFCNPFQPCRESDVCLDALIILFHAE